jgi:hypothetical protein
MNAADQWLHRTLRSLRDWHDLHPDLAEPLEQALAGVEALAVAGAVPAAGAEAWRARFTRAAAGQDEPAAGAAALRERLGQPSEEDEEDDDEPSSWQAELVDVLAGACDVRGEHRLLLVLRFADGVAFLVDDYGDDQDDWPDWTLTDDLGTRYEEGGLGGGEGVHIAFDTPIPPGASWVELALEGHDDVVFRVPLV